MLTTMVATLGGFLFGYDSGVIFGTIRGLKWPMRLKTIVFHILCEEIYPKDRGNGVGRDAWMIKRNSIFQ